MHFTSHPRAEVACFSTAGGGRLFLFSVFVISQEKNAELQRLQTAYDELQGHKRQWEKERSALRHKFSRSQEELHSATLRVC